MKRSVFLLLALGISLMAADGEALSAKCTYCHGAYFETAAMGKSAIVQGQSASDIYASLKGYKQGTRNTAGLATIMRSQVSSFSDDDLQAIAEYVASLSKPELACEGNDVRWVLDNRYFTVSGSNFFPLILADSKTIQIDRKNKIIKVWIVSLISGQHRKKWMNDFGYKYSNYGYVKNLSEIDYKNMRYKANTLTNYECNGYTISSLLDDEWVSIKSGSSIKEITTNIMKKYNLE